MVCVAVCSRIRATIHQACFPSLSNWDVVYLILGVGRGIQPPWMLFEQWYWPEPTCAPSRSFLAAHRLHLFLLSQTAQPRWHCRWFSSADFIVEVAHYEQHVPLRDLFNCLRQVLVEPLHFFIRSCCCCPYTWIRVLFHGFALSRATRTRSLIGSCPTSASLIGRNALTWHSSLSIDERVGSWPCIITCTCTSLQWCTVTWSCITAS